MHKDKRGQTITVGDTVVYAMGDYSRVIIGKVLRETPKRVVVARYGNSMVKDPAEVVVIDKKTEECSICGKHTTDARMRLDPYKLEIHCIEEEIMICDNCYHELCMDI